MSRTMRVRNENATAYFHMDLHQIGNPYSLRTVVLAADALTVNSSKYVRSKMINAMKEAIYNGTQIRKYAVGVNTEFESPGCWIWYQNKP